MTFYQTNKSTKLHPPGSNLVPILGIKTKELMSDPGVEDHPGVERIPYSFITIDYSKSDFTIAKWNIKFKK